MGIEFLGPTADESFTLATFFQPGRRIASLISRAAGGWALLAAPWCLGQVIVDQSFQAANPPDWSFSKSSGSFTPASGVFDWRTFTRSLQLANNTTNEATAAVFTGNFNASGASIYAQFNYQMYGGSGGTTLGGDGFTFFLYDASKTFSAGAYGGSLGYAQKTGIDGLSGGYIGVGLDAFGNYSAASEGRVGGYNGTTSPVTESIGVRGPGQGQTGYAYLGGTGAFLDQGASIDTSGGWFTTNTVQILLTATNQLTVTLAQGGTTPQTVLQMDLSGYARPDLLSFGFTAGTGGATDNIVVNNLTVSKLTASRWSNAGGNGNWGLNTNWNPTVVPTSGSDILLDNSSVTTAQIIDTAADRTVRSVMLDAPFAYTINNNTLTIDSGTIPGFSGISATQTHGSANHTINSNLALNNDATIRNNSTGALTVNGAIATGVNTLTVDGSGTSTFLNGAISGSGALMKNDLGAVTLGSANTYTGGTIINSGTLYANNNGALGTGAVTLAGGVLASTNNAAVNNAITLTNDAGLTNLQHSGTLTQSGGDRVLTLSNAVQSGAVNLSNNGTNRTLTVQVDSGTSTISGVVANGGGSTASGLSKTGAGTLVLSGQNTYTGTTTISNGVIQLGGSNLLADASSLSIGGSGTFNLNGFSEKVGALNVLAGGATIDFGAAAGANTFVFGTYTAPTSGVLVINNFENGTDRLATVTSGLNVSTVYLSGLGVATLDGFQTNLGGVLGSGYLLKGPGTSGNKTWQGSSSSWNTYGNWSPNGVPGNGAIVVFGSGGNATVTLDKAGQVLAGIQFASNAKSFTIGGSNTLTLSGSVPYIQQKSTNLQTISTGLSIASNSVIDMTGSGNLQLSGNLTGSGNLVKDGTGNGKLILSGANGSYTGDIYINNGILQAASAGALGSATSTGVNIAQGAMLELASNGTAANAINVIGTGVGGAGAIHNLTGSNTLSGTVLQSGDTALGAEAGTTLALTGNLTGSAVTTSFVGAGNISVSQISTSGGAVVVNSTGTVTFNGSTANTYSGTTTVNSGTLALAKSTGTTAVAGNLMINGGAVRLNAADQISGGSSVTLNGAAQLNLNGYSDTIGQLNSTSAASTVALGAGTLGINAVNNLNSAFAGALTGTSASVLNVTGSGKVNLSGNSAGFAGRINVTGGTLNASGSNSALGTGSVTVGSGANLQIQGGISLANALTLSGNGTSSNGVLQNFGGNNNVTGPVTLAASSLIAADTGSLGISGSVSTNGNRLTIGGGGSTTISGAITGNGGAVTKADSGTLTLSGTNTYTGGTNIDAGIVVSGSRGLGTGTVAVADGATLRLQSSSTIANAFTLDGAGVANAGAIENLGGSTTLSGAITLGGSTRLQSDGGGLVLSGSVSLGGSTLTIAGAGATTMLGAVSGSGGLTKTDAGTLTLGAANSYAGATNVTGGTLSLAAAGSINSSASINVSGASLAINATNAIVASANLTVSSGANVSLGSGLSQTISGLTTDATTTINVGANSVLTVNRASTSTLLGSLTGTGTLAYTGGGSLILGNDLNFNGTLAFTGGGTLSVGATVDFGGTLLIGGGTLALGNHNLNVGTLHITGNTVLDFGNSTATTLNATNLIIDAGVNVSVVNWVNMTDYFIAQNFQGAVLNQRGAAPENQVTFSGYTNNQTGWVSWNHEVTPAPEPSTYGAILIGAALGCFGLARWRLPRRR
jgi:autotransporter-associated beta strand protein